MRIDHDPKLDFDDVLIRPKRGAGEGNDPGDYRRLDQLGQSTPTGLIKLFGRHDGSTHSMGTTVEGRR